MGKTKYTFDLANRLETETNPLLKVTRYTYDAAGNRRTKLDANNHVTTYSYDDNRRLTRVDFDDGSFYEYGFDTRGNRTLEKGPSHERHLHYDGLNRLDVVDDVTFGKQLTYAYDAAGNRTRVSEGGVDHVYEYDSRNMLAAARVGAGARTFFGYDAMGRRSFVARPNGVRTDYAYDDASQLLSMVHAKSGNVLLGFSYGYDGQGNRVSKTREDGTAEVYGYDASLRLTRVDYGTSKTVVYTLDSLGNRSLEAQTDRLPNGTSVFTNYSATFNGWNQMLTRSRSGGGLPALNTTFAYDDNGSTLSETTGTAVTSYTWDRDNRLRTVTQPAPGVPSSYSYDANGLRVQRVDATGTTRYLLDGPSVLAEFDGTNAVTARYLNNPEAMDEAISFERGGSTYWPVTDALGSVYAVTDVSGAVVHRFDFDVYGERADLGGAGPAFDVGFTGQRHDANGLMGIGQRPYMPRTGLWLEPDRAGMIDGPNRYLYVGNQPTSLTDPTGKFAMLGLAKAVGTVAAQIWIDTGIRYIGQGLESGDDDGGLGEDLFIYGAGFLIGGVVMAVVFGRANCQQGPSPKLFDEIVGSGSSQIWIRGFTQVTGRSLTMEVTNLAARGHGGFALLRFFRQALITARGSGLSELKIVARFGRNREFFQALTEFTYQGRRFISHGGDLVLTIPL